jgi:hypothetical protein
MELPTPQEGPLFLDFSPDGSALVFLIAESGEDDAAESTQRLWLRRLDSFSAAPIPGTERGHHPVFSPDGRHIAFVVDREGGAAHQADLRVVALDGRPPLTVATDTIDHAGPQWLSADEIVYVDRRSERRLRAVRRGGGESRLFTELPEDSSTAESGSLPTISRKAPRSR